MVNWESNLGEPIKCPHVHPKSTDGITLCLLLGVPIQKYIHNLRCIHIYTYIFSEFTGCPWPSTLRSFTSVNNNGCTPWKCSEYLCLCSQCQCFLEMPFSQVFLSYLTVLSVLRLSLLLKTRCNLSWCMGKWFNDLNFKVLLWIHLGMAIFSCTDAWHSKILIT